MATRDFIGQDTDRRGFIRRTGLTLIGGLAAAAGDANAAEPKAGSDFGTDNFYHSDRVSVQSIAFPTPTA